MSLIPRRHTPERWAVIPRPISRRPPTTPSRARPRRAPGPGTPPPLVDLVPLAAVTREALMYLCFAVGSRFFIILRQHDRQVDELCQFIESCFLKAGSLEYDEYLDPIHHRIGLAGQFGLVNFIQSRVYSHVVTHVEERYRWRTRRAAENVWANDLDHFTHQYWEPGINAFDVYVLEGSRVIPSQLHPLLAEAVFLKALVRLVYFRQPGFAGLHTGGRLTHFENRLGIVEDQSPLCRRGFIFKLLLIGLWIDWQTERRASPSAPLRLHGAMVSHDRYDHYNRGEIEQLWILWRSWGVRNVYQAPFVALHGLHLVLQQFHIESERELRDGVIPFEYDARLVPDMRYLNGSEYATSRRHRSRRQQTSRGTREGTPYYKMGDRVPEYAAPGFGARLYGADARRSSYDTRFSYRAVSSPLPRGTNGTPAREMPRAVQRRRRPRFYPTCYNKYNDLHTYADGLDRAREAIGHWRDQFYPDVAAQQHAIGRQQRRAAKSTRVQQLEERRLYIQRADLEAQGIKVNVEGEENDEPDERSPGWQCLGTDCSVS